MMYNITKNNYFKSLILIIVPILLDYLGIYKQLCELSYNRNYYLPYNEELLTSYVIRNYSYLHNPVDNCNFHEDKLTLVFVIKSAVKHTLQREVIRRTWSQAQLYANIQLKTFFMLGYTYDVHLQQNIIDEAKHFNDIIQADFDDVYHNNTLKTVLGLQWITQNCQKSNYYLFVDDDYYVSVKNLLRFISETDCYPADTTYNMAKSNGNKLFAGHVFVKSRPPRHVWSKWYVSLAEYPYDSWPPYITGGALLISHDSLMDLYEACMRTRFFRLDDVFLGMAAHNGNINLTHCKLFHFQKPEFTSAENYKHIIASHGYGNPIELEHVWNACYAAGFA